MSLGAAIAAGVNGVLSGYSTYSSGKLSNISNKYAAKTNELNAKLAGLSAENALRRGEKEQQQILVSGAKMKGAQKTGYAANGIDISSRSVQNVLNETDVLTEIDRLQAESNALSESWNYRLQQAQYQGNAMIAKSKIRNPLSGALLSGLASGLSAYAAAGGFDGTSEAANTAANNAAPAVESPQIYELDSDYWAKRSGVVIPTYKWG